MKTPNGYRIGFIAVAVISFASAHAQVLRIGDPAPKLKVDRWLKGTPVPRFEKGKVYVIEFWATWCGPCKVAMPHLSALSKKYAGKATFVGVNIWENQHAKPGENLDAKVGKFVKEIGDAMAYNVCTESKDDYMTKSWMKAASQGGIPATFVVDQDSKVAWIGHPIYLEEPLIKIIDGKFDAKAFAANFEKQRRASQAREKIYNEAMAPIKAALAAKNYAEAVAACERAIAKDPVMKMAYAIPKFEALMSDGPEKAYDEALKVRDDWDQAYMAAQLFISKDGLDPKFYRYAFDLGEARYKAHPEEKNRLSLLAKSSARLGDYAKAVEFQTLFVEWAKSINLDPANMKDLTDELQRYKDAAGK